MNSELITRPCVNIKNENQARWHKFGFDADNEPVAIIEYDDGEVDVIPAYDVKFLDRKESE